MKGSGELSRISDRLIHLSRCKGVTRRIIQHILALDSELKQIYSLTAEQLIQIYQFSERKAHLLYNSLHNPSLIEQIKRDKTQCSIITILDHEYPSVLRMINDPPFVLYALGDHRLLNYSPSLSVIGTRKPTREAWDKTKLMIQPLIEEGWAIVSGMARGIDTYAHKITIEGSGKTIAVLGSGFHHIYPMENQALFTKIRKTGIVLSEYPPSMPASKHHFPERNRIISGLAFGTLVIEATEKSGTLITVDQALDQGREVYALPGSPLVAQTKGCHRMIQEGAKLVTGAASILEDWEAQGEYFTLIK
ncbi:DNA-processing protein DprA [Oceanobacillus kapialis]|uniref:DNA-processing protein DprA n=1 Tax=Oceanobacillus kapialis TaxID=481353 RepID=UPI00384CBFD0